MEFHRAYTLMDTNAVVIGRLRSGDGSPNGIGDHPGSGVPAMTPADNNFLPCMAIVSKSGDLAPHQERGTAWLEVGLKDRRLPVEERRR